MTTFQVIAPTASALAAATSALVATRALGVNRRSALITQLLGAYGDMVTALHQISSEGERVGREALRDSDAPGFEDFVPSLTRTEPVLRPIHDRYGAAAARVSIVEPVASSGYSQPNWPFRRAASQRADEFAAHGAWVREVAGDLAWSLVDAAIAHDLIRMQLTKRWSLPRREPAISDEEWNILSHNGYYLRFANVLAARPQPDSPFDRLEAHARRTVLGHRHGYYTDAGPHMPQAARVLHDFTRHFVEPWCRFVAVRVSEQRYRW
ncbi:hypothetical protein GPX89_39410 [Nocardia sp. ET3-3]|uniref:Uncharacterized protein n=1 Tax=Nocardia terrae TaxID=2675851 RepID=A0A7K1V9I0_9NOCA|nr:hypothetical protein [Nocardia terrae]MVU83294.1 hypothetical protein [Nocardia terrae]